MADLLPLLLILVAAGMLAAFFDCATADEFSIRHFPRMVWLAAILLLPGVGALLWLVSGKVRGGPIPDYITSGHPAGRARVAHEATETAPQRTVAPDDDPDFLAQIAARVAEMKHTGQRDAADLAGTGARGEGAPAGTATPDLHDLPDETDLPGQRNAAGPAELAAEEERLRAWEADLRRREERLRRQRKHPRPPAGD